ncbi:MAG: gamma-butyrobetaine dioxygenase [Myxococcales bacterium]|nr:MAG: gamma-butyrobetaine dioxygenase [Myxococcales bacterium]
MHDTWLRVPFATGEHADFHYRWLRHNCDLDRHPTTGERTVCSSDLPDVVSARRAWVSGDTLVLEWAHDGRQSAYDLGWLRRHAYALGREATTIASDLGPVQFTAPSSAEAARLALGRVRAHGLAVLRRGDTGRAPEDDTEPLIEAFERQGLRVIGTHFGRIEDLRTDNTTNANTDQLGYTDAGIELHTDQPFLDTPPRYQLLQGIRRADEGGESFLADARSAWRHLATIDARAATLLATVPVRFHRQQKHFERIVDAPLIHVGASDDDFQVRFSYFTLAPHRLPFAQLDEYYRAHDRFARLVRDPAHQYRFTLNPGDWVLYDNHRMLHGRTGFRGPRWVRGVYLDRA